MELTRRQWLLSALALAGCPAAPALPAGLRGGIVGPSDLRGHQVRRRHSLPAPSLRWRTEVAILGGGISGLSAAWALRRAGLEDLLVLELEDAPGGTSGWAPGPVSPRPWGAHYLPVPSQHQRAVCTLLSELGVLQGFDAAGRAICAEEALCRAPQERIFYKGRWYEGLYLRAGASAEDLRQLDRFHAEVGRWVRARGTGGQRVFTLPSALGDRQAASELDRMTFADWLRGLGLTSSRLRFYADYACRDDFGLPASATSAWAGVHYFAARLLHPDDRPPEVLTWPEGNGWLVQQLAHPLGDRLRTGCVVLQVHPLVEAREGAEVVFLHGEQTGRLRARHVIFALPAFLRRHLLPPAHAAPAWLEAFQYSPWLVANLTLRNLPVPPGTRSPVPGFPLCWDNVLVDSPSLGYVVATHQREPPPPPDGVPRSAWTWYLPLGEGHPAEQRARLLQTPWQSWVRLLLQDLGRAEPDLAARLERVDLYRWGHAMVRPVPGLFTSGVLERAAAPLGPIHFAHTDLAGMALFEEAQHAGVRAAEAVMAARGHPFEALSS
ncbi:MAG: FAD-dependent oxidoreductase [Myxococcales bacterium]|nr:FAD-dependent oxidoreductase [Myxococcota bacterium]MDW8282691.1 FAD-dependent oxidoreductase [Myxococcales bacterium]